MSSAFCGIIYTYNMGKLRKSWQAQFKQQEQFSPRNKKEELLIEALVKLKDKKEMTALLRDLMTLHEIEEFANRLEMARLLLKGKSYQKIADEIGVSTSTVTRVAHWLFSGCGGYQKVFKKLLKIT